jgi:hypothetical protein
MIPVTHLPERSSLRLALQVLGALLVFGAGISLGTHLTFSHGKLLRAAYASADEELFTAYLAAQRTAGTAAQHENALRYYITMLKRQQDHPTLLVVPKVAATQELFAYLKLSKMAQRQGDVTAAQSYIAEAQTLCRQEVHWGACTAQDMETIGNRINELLKCRFPE